MPRRGENIRKRKDGRWEGRFIKGYAPDGKAKYGYVYAPTYAQAREAKREAQMRFEKGGIPAKTEKSRTLREVFFLWLQDIRPSIKPSTYAQYISLWERYIGPELGTVPLKKLNSERIDLFTHTLAAHGRADGSGLSPKTVRDTLSIIKCAVRYAIERGWLPEGKIIFRPIRQSPAAAIQVFSPEEQQRLLAFWEESAANSPCCCGMILALMTGLRIGEVCALTWDDIDLKNAVLHVRHTLLRIRNTAADSPSKTKVILCDPKTSSSFRNIPLPRRLVPLFSRLQAQALPHSFLLTGNHAFLEPRTYLNRYKASLRALKIPPRSFHTLRHTFATRCIEAGVDIKTLSEILGHAGVQITLNQYVHSTMEQKRYQLERLASHFQ